MTIPGQPDERTLEAFFDGELPEAEHAAFEALLRDDPDLAGEVARQRDIDAALRRTFASPEDLLDRLEVAGLPRTDAPRRRLTILRSFLGVLAAAAIVFVFTRLAGVQEVAPAEEPPVEVASAGITAFPVDPGRDPDEVESPNLERLYLDAAGQEGQSQCSGPGDLTDLERELTTRYGSGLSVLPEASGVIHGPFDSTEWPSGMVMTSYPDGPSGQPVVLVAEQEAQLACCLDVSLPQSSGLQLFTWKVGALLLTEITPHREPRLIGCFRDDS